VGLAPRLWADAPVQEAFADLCRRLHAEGYQALLIPMQESQDRALCEAIAAATGAQALPPPQHPAPLLGVTAHGLAGVEVRRRGARVAAAAGAPGLCGGDDPKVDALAAPRGAATVPLRALDRGLAEAWGAFPREALHARLQQTVPALQAAAKGLLARVQTAYQRLPETFTTP